LNLRLRGGDFQWAEISIAQLIGETGMTKAARIVATIPAARVSREKSDNTFVSIALFSGIGVLVSLVAILMGVQGAWY
jgi:hypothetical protein